MTHVMMSGDKQSEIMHRLHDTGHLAMPFGERQELPNDAVHALTLDHSEVRKAIASYQHFMVINLESLMAKHHPERRTAAPKIDGSIGPATLELFEEPRCGMPDYEPAMDEATGSGQWRSCHDIGKYHAAIARLTNDPPSHLKRPHQEGTVWDAVKQRCRECYAEVGLRWWFSDDAEVPEGGHQTELSFVTRSSGWIGLAILGQGQQCSSNPLWLRLLATYLRSSSITDSYLRLWANLLIHELGHNCGSGHTSGGIMNPSILRVENTWIGDPAESRMKNWFGGEPVPLDDDQPPPTPPPVGGLWSGSLKNAEGATIVLSGIQL